MRADTWADVYDCARNFAQALVSRLHAYVPRERARREAYDRAFMAHVRAVMREADEHEGMWGDVPHTASLPPLDNAHTSP